jgi:hypothetical protein
MKLKKVVFYQAVKLWDGNSTLTVNEGSNKKLEDVTINIEDHMVTLECPQYDEVIAVGTSNMREARYDRQSTSIPEVPSKKTGKVDVQPVSSDLKTDGDVPTQPGGSKEASGATEGGVQSAPSGFDPSKYAGKPKEEKVTKPKAQKAIK